MPTTLLDVVKKNIRVTHTALDLDEIIPLIESAKKDLELTGIKKIDESDQLIQRAIILYCKANFGYDNPDSEKFEMKYEKLKGKLSLAGEYNGQVE